MDPDVELQRIRQCYGDPQQRPVLELIERQFTVLTNRAQILLALCGIVITTTGFSGRLIAGTNALAQGLIIAGVSLTLLAAALVVTGVMPLRWMTQQPGDGIETWLRQTLSYRNRKVAMYRLAILVLLAGLTLYVAAIAVMLLHPEAHAVAPAR